MINIMIIIQLISLFQGWIGLEYKPNKNTQEGKHAFKHLNKRNK